MVDTVGAGDASIGGLLYSLMSVPDGRLGDASALFRRSRRGRVPAGRCDTADVAAGRAGARTDGLTRGMNPAAGSAASLTSAA